MAVRNCADFVSVNGRTEREPRGHHGLGHRRRPAEERWPPLARVGASEERRRGNRVASLLRTRVDAVDGCLLANDYSRIGRTQTIRREELLIFRLYEVVGGGPRESADEHVACSRRSRSDWRARRVRDGACVRFVTSLVGLDGIVHRNVDSSEIKEP